MSYFGQEFVHLEGEKLLENEFFKIVKLQTSNLFPEIRNPFVFFLNKRNKFSFKLLKTP